MGQLSELFEGPIRKTAEESGKEVRQIKYEIDEDEKEIRISVNLSDIPSQSVEQPSLKEGEELSDRQISPTKMQPAASGFSTKAVMCYTLDVGSAIPWSDDLANSESDAYAHAVRRINQVFQATLRSLANANAMQVDEIEVHFRRIAVD